MNIHRHFSWDGNGDVRTLMAVFSLTIIFHTLAEH